MFEQVKETTLTPEIFFGALISADIPIEKWKSMLLIKINTFVRKTQKLAATILAKQSTVYDDYIQEEFDKLLPTRTQYPIPETYEEFVKKYGDFISTSDIEITKYFDSIFQSEDLEESKNYAVLSFTIKLKDGSNITGRMVNNTQTTEMITRINQYFKPSRYGNHRVFNNIASYIVYTATPEEISNDSYFEALLLRDVAEISAKGYALSLAGGILGRFLETNLKDMFKRFF